MPVLGKNIPQRVIDALDSIFGKPSSAVSVGFNLGSAIQDALGSDHNHSNLTILDATQQSFTTALKQYYDDAVNRVTTLHEIVYVDKSRVDTYTENGSIAQPFKTIQGAIDAVAAKGASAYTTIKILNGIYSENLVLENAGLKYIKLQGEGYVSINPVGGNALQSAANNDNLIALHIDNIIFAKPVVLTGSNGSVSFQDVILQKVSFTGTASITATCLNNLTLKDCYGEQPIIFVNVNWSYMESCQLQGTLSITMDSTVNLPSWGANGTILANGIFQSGSVSYTIGGIATYTVAPNGCRWGSAAITIPAGVSILAYNSYLRGTVTNNGSVTLRNSCMDGYISGTGTLNLNGQKGSYIGYTAANPGNWATQPVDVNEAIDRLAAAIFALNGGVPIP